METLDVHRYGCQYIWKLREMETINEIIDAALVKIGKESDRQLSIYIGVSPQTVSNWRHKTCAPDAYALMELQKILGIDAREILAIIEAERAKTEERRGYWEEIKKSFSKSGTSIALAFALAAIMTMSPRSAEAAERSVSKAINNDFVTVYYVK